MQAIYEAILLIPHSPTQATKVLNNLAKQKTHFLELLKDMALQLFDRFQPTDPKSQKQYELMSKQILVIYNLYVKVSFKQKGQNIYLYIQQMYQWIVSILACEKIAVTAKKVLVPAVVSIINSICFKTQKFTTLLDWLTAKTMESSDCIFVYLQALLQSEVNVGIKIETIEHSFNHLYYIALYHLTNAVQYYKNRYMDEDCGQAEEYSIFKNILKGNQYIVSTICEMINFIYNLSVKKRYKYSRDDLLSQVLLSPQLALYMCRILKLENEMFESRNENLFGLKIIIANNLRRHQKIVINKTKSLCLNMLRLILSVSDKDFNLVHTDKLLMKDLFNLSNLIIEELFICSSDKVINTLDEELSMDNIICSLYEVEAEIVLFNDIKPTLLEMNVQQIVRISMGFMKTREQEMRIFETDVQQYFVLVYYILYGTMEDQQQEEIDLSVGQASVKKSVVVLVKNLMNSASGYHSIMIEICCDYVLLEMQMRDTPNQQLKKMFLDKYSVPNSIFQCLSVQSCLFMFTVLLKKCINQLQQKKKLRFVLSTIKLNYLSQLQLCRLFVCLAINAMHFTDRDMQCNYYHIIEKVFKLQNIANSVCKHGYHLLDRLVNSNRQYSHQYSIFIDKILNEAIEEFTTASCPYLFQFLLSAVKNKEVVSTVVNLSWINLCLAKLKDKIMQELKPKFINQQLISVAVKLYAKVVKSAIDGMQQFKSQPYETFQLESDQFNNHINVFLAWPFFQKLQLIAIQNQLISEQMCLILQFNNFLFDLLVMDVFIKPQTVQLLTNYSICVLNRKEDIGDEYDNSVFKLLYQVINKNTFQLTQQHYLIILNWMKWEMERQDNNEVFINRVCIIMQLFYYRIASNVFFRDQMLQFLGVITETIEKKLIKYLLDYQDFVQLVQNEPDPDRRKINIGNLHLHPSAAQKKRNPVTIIRLYNTILLNPNFNPKSIHIIKDIIKFYIMQTMPAYDLSVQVIALKFILQKSRNSGVVECFRLALEILYYNTNHPEPKNIEKNSDYTLRTLTEPLRSQISFTDPYNELFQLVNNLIQKNKDDTVLIDYNVDFESVEVDVVEFIKSDAYTRELVHKLSSIRRVNNQARVIRKIKRHQQSQF